MIPFDLKIPPRNHTFVPKPESDRDDFRCAKCGDPRALHVDDGFVPSPVTGCVVSSEEGEYRQLRKPHETP